MFFKKQQPKEEVQEVKVCNHKVCYKCGHLFETGGKKVEVRGFERYLNSYSAQLTKEVFFCEEHIPKYDLIYYGYSYIRYYKIVPEQRIEVNENGEPIKKK